MSNTYTQPPSSAEVLGVGISRVLDAHIPYSFSPEVPYFDHPEVAAVIQAATPDSVVEAQKHGDVVDRLILVDMRSVPESEPGYKKFEGELIDSSAVFLLIDPVNLDFKQNQGFKGLRVGQNFTFGRPRPGAPATDPRTRFSSAGSLTSRAHFEIVVDATGSVTVKDLGSKNGTTLLTGARAEEAMQMAERDPHELSFAPQIRRATSRHSSAPSHVEQWAPVGVGPNYDNALAMHPDELWTLPGNDGREQDAGYIRNYQTIRERIVDAFRSGELYRSPQAFIAFLKASHKFLGETGDYNRLNDRRRLSEHQYGEFNEPGAAFANTRLGQSLDVVEIARRYGDPYGSGDRFNRGPRNGESVSKVYLPGINPHNLPHDVVRYDWRGRPRPVDREDYSNSGYEFDYPDTAGITEYLTEAWRTGVAPGCHC